MLNQIDQATLMTIRAETESTLREAIGDVRDVAILDAPNQRNIGDSLIWEGELSYLDRLGYRIRYVSDLNGYDSAALRSRLPRDGVVLLHGGGNFGDLWLGHQNHREQIVKDLPDFRIVQLPQSIFFSDHGRAAHANARLSRHPDFLALIRDSTSIERASALLPDVRHAFCPDMAFGWTPPPRTGRHVRRDDILVIARQDRESSSGLAQLTPDWISGRTLRLTDWGVHAKDSLSWHVARGVAWVNQKLVSVRRRLRMPFTPLPQRVTQAAIKKINSANVRSALKLYEKSSVLVVDRLHAHILAILLGKPHVVLDNNYRKIGSVYDDYTGDFSTASYSTDIHEAQTLTKKNLERM